MSPTFIFMLLLLAVCGAVYFLVIKPKIDASKAASSPVVSPATALKEEKGAFLGTGNSMGHGLRPLWKFRYETKMVGGKAVTPYGKEIEFWTGPDYDHLTKRLVVHDSMVRTPTVSLDDLYKPISDVQPPGCIFHGAGGSLDTKCVMKYKGN